MDGKRVHRLNSRQYLGHHALRGFCTGGAHSTLRLSGLKWAADENPRGRCPSKWMRAISNLWGRLLGSAIGLAVAGTAFGAPLQDWFFKAGAEIFSVPAVDQKSLYFGACDGNFYCLDKKSGKQRWRRGGFDRIDSSPVI